MPAQVVLGAQWGDEGKGKLVDQLAQDAEWVARFQGGNNAGHTIVLGDQVLKLHQLPSGLTNPDCQLVLGAGMVVDPWVLEDELNRWKESSGESPEGERLWISERAHVNLPFHRLYDSADKKIGTTGRGIGPTYRDKIERVGVRFCDLKHRRADSEWLEEHAARMTSQLAAHGVEGEISSADLKASLDWVSERYGSSIKPTGLMLDLALRQGQNVLLEGAQGCLLDIDHGTYPFVTSSVTSRANATHGAGIHPGHVDEVIGITKAYITRVGNGAMPTELLDEVGDHLGTVGHEFGTTTGRKRRCGWFDGVLVRQTIKISGINGIALTKLDVLDELEEIKMCIQYELNGKKIDYLPSAPEDQLKVKPIYKVFEGWKSSTKGTKNIDDLPDNAKKYIFAVEDFIGAKISSISTSPEREDTILLENPFEA